MAKFSVSILMALPFVANSFTLPTTSRLTSSTNLNLFNNKKEVTPSTRPAQFEAPEKGSGNILESTFTGGAFEDEPADEILASAAAIASKIKSVKDLGWSQSGMRRGQARPRHRAWGGEGEMPIQDKANYDEKRENCVEKWLTYEDFLAATRASPGPAADSVFVALAGGSKYAEREICEEKIAQWTGGASEAAPASSGGMFGRKASRAASFNEAAFIKTVNEGRRDLGLGWGAFLSINFFFASCIIFPTNPAAKGLESLVDSLKDQALQ
mmetsp:Transcript_13080/g.19595  ORF Transcript_13080/g.19595 Transcript_13080/m.19595 type:complete len:269 (-) Transcript_13080:89-895(-)